MTVTNVSCKCIVVLQREPLKFVHLFEEACVAYQREITPEVRAVEAIIVGFEGVTTKRPPFDPSKCELVKMEGFITRVKTGCIALQMTVMCKQCERTKVRPASIKAGSVLWGRVWPACRSRCGCLLTQNVHYTPFAQVVNRDMGRFGSIPLGTCCGSQSLVPLDKPPGTYTDEHCLSFEVRRARQNSSRP